jgi:hypothetical protein
VHNHFTVTGNYTQDSDRAILALGDGFKHVPVCGPNEKRIVLLVFRSPDFQDRQGVIANVDLLQRIC